jgi:outer membrane protein, heavy metal efflux system
MEVARLDDELREWEAMRPAAAARLAANLGRRSATGLSAPGLLPPQVPAAAREPLGVWLDDSPEYLAAQREVRREESAVALARRERLPDFMLGIEAMDNRGMARDEVQVMASVNLPIWQGRNRAAVREAEAAREAARAGAEAMRLELEAELAMVQFRLLDAERKLQLYRAELAPRAEQAARAAEAAYRVGELPFYELIEMQRVLLTIRLDEARAAAELQRRAAELERLLGRPLASLGAAS